jgi:hypothetical protein
VSRITGALIYKTEHGGEQGVTTEVTWSVPYSALLSRCVPHRELEIDEIELDGQPTVVSVAVVLDGLRDIHLDPLIIEVPVTDQQATYWRLVWAKVTRLDVVLGEIHSQIATKLREDHWAKAEAA